MGWAMALGMTVVSTMTLFTDASERTESLCAATMVNGGLRLQVSLTSEVLPIRVFNLSVHHHLSGAIKSML